MKDLLGDYQAFFASLNEQLQELRIDISGKELSHLTYRVETMGEYEHMRDVLKWYSSELAETQYQGRPIAIFVLKEPLALAEGFGVSMIELPAPKKDHPYPKGLEQLAINLADELPEFKVTYKGKITAIKDRKPYSSPAYITFKDGKSVSFAQRGIREIIGMQGWGFTKLK